MLIALFVGQASAHVISIGYVNSGPGSVSFYYGSYHNPSEFPAFGTEGSLQLEGINGNPFAPVIVPFTIHSSTKPVGLTDGTNNFYASSSLDDGVLESTNSILTVLRWQGVSFAGLSPGDYRFTYIPIANPTVTWDPWNNEVRTNVVTLTGADVGAPEPTSLAIFGLSAAGLGLIGYRRRKLAR